MHLPERGRGVRPLRPPHPASWGLKEGSRRLFGVRRGRGWSPEGAVGSGVTSRIRACRPPGTRSSRGPACLAIRPTRSLPVRAPVDAETGCRGFRRTTAAAADGPEAPGGATPMSDAEGRLGSGVISGAFVGETRGWLPGSPGVDRTLWRRRFPRREERHRGSARASPSGSPVGPNGRRR